MEGGAELSFPDANDDDLMVAGIVQKLNNALVRPRSEPSRVNTLIDIGSEEDSDRIFIPRPSCENVRWSVRSQNSIVH